MSICSWSSARKSSSSLPSLDFKEELEALLGRPVDLVERQAVEASRNAIRRRRILGEALLIYAA